MRGTMRGIRGGAVLLALVVGAAGCESSTEPGPTLDIIETARNAGSFTTLVAAVEAAGLTATLKGPGPFTVFAPRDEAFAALPAGTVESLIANPTALAAILTYHVVPGEVLESQVVNLTSAPTVNGKALTIQVTAGGVLVDGARVVQTDIRATNGVIHVIDSVLIP